VWPPLCLPVARSDFGPLMAPVMFMLSPGKAEQHRQISADGERRQLACRIDRSLLVAVTGGRGNKDLDPIFCCPTKSRRLRP
jgi:hypothetical protein